MRPDQLLVHSRDIGILYPLPLIKLFIECGSHLRERRYGLLCGRGVGAIDRAQQLAGAAGLLLVVGSSLEVHPVAALPGATLASGGALAIVNRGATPWDSRAELVLDGGAGQTLRALESALGIVEPDPARRSDG